MADESKQGRQAQSSEASVEQRPAVGGTESDQVKPTSELSAKEVKARVLHEPSRDIHPSGEPEHAADQTSVPGPTWPPLDRPPVATTRPDEPIVQSLVTGAGAHMPPDPDKYDAFGRPKDVV